MNPYSFLLNWESVCKTLGTLGSSLLAARFCRHLPKLIKQDCPKNEAADAYMSVFVTE